MGNKIMDVIASNGGGLHIDVRLGKPVLIEHNGEILELYFNGYRTSGKVSITIKGSRDFKIDFKSHRRNNAEEGNV